MEQLLTDVKHIFGSASLKVAFGDVDFLKSLLVEAWENHLITGVLVYVLMQPLLRLIFKNGRFYNNNKAFWKKLMALYNLIMSLYSLVTFILVFGELRQTGVWISDCGEGPWTSELFGKLCHYFFLSKYVEYADTAFLIIAQKPVGLLQYFHHLGAPLDMWVLNRFQNPGVFIFIGFNSCIHTFMYLYFAGTAMGVHLAPLKSIMTSGQLIQLSYGTYISGYYPARLECYRQNTGSLFSWLFSFTYTIILFVLFADFFIKAYLVKKPKPSATENATKKKQ